MTTYIPGQPARGSSGRTWVKATAALILLLLLGWVGLTVGEYFRTGKPLSQIPTMPAPLQKLVEEPPRYLGAIDGPVAPLGVAVGPNGMVYVTESDGERMVRAYSADGQPVFSIGTSGASVGSRLPAYVALSPGGDLYVTDINLGKLLKFSADGQFSGEVASPFAEGWRPLGVAFDHGGNLYVTDITEKNHRVVVLDPEGKLLQQFGTEGTKQGEFWFPNAVAIDAGGNVYVSDSNNGRVQAFDSKGTYLWTIGRGTRKGDLANPRGVAVDDERKFLFVVDTLNNQVNMYDISGAAPKFLTAIGGDTVGDPSTFSYPNGIVLDGKGHAYVTDRANNRVTTWSY